MKKVLVIVGPTASGKSDLAVKLARKFNGEVISADSRQVYKGLNAGTGKITKKEMLGIPHHMLDVADPKKQFSASDYKEQAELSLHQIESRKKLPIIVGGTGFYIDALTGKASLPEVPPNKKLRKELEKLTTERLFKMLQKKDPRRALNIDAKNKVRLVRALEIIDALGAVPEIGSGRRGSNFVFIGIKPDQEMLDKKIYDRLIERLPGMIKEAKKLKAEKLSYKRMDQLGLEYRYLALYLQNKLTKEEFIGELYKEIRKYSKRQMTWFKRDKSIKWFAPDEYRSILTFLNRSIG